MRLGCARGFVLCSWNCLLKHLSVAANEMCVRSLSGIAFACIMLVACNPRPSHSFLLDVEPRHDVFSATEFLPDAMHMAKDWAPSAYLIWVDIRIQPGASVATYAFNTLEDPEKGLLVFNETSGGAQSVQTREVYAEGRKEARPPIESDAWHVDSPEVAAQAFRRARGFLAENPEIAEVSVELAGLSGSAAGYVDATTGELVWSVMFYSSSGTILDLYYDPLSGDFLGEVIREN